VEPHLCAYHATLAHASAVRSFRRLVPGGKIGMTNAVGWAEPFTSSAADAGAAERQQAFSGGFFLDPLYRGDWTPERKAVYGDRLPAFTPEQRRLLLDNQVRGRSLPAWKLGWIPKGMRAAPALTGFCVLLLWCTEQLHPLPSTPALQQDFIALQHYTGSWTYEDTAKPPLNASSTVVGADGVALPQADSPWLFVFPRALRSLLGWLQRRYGAPIFITENGVSAPGKGRSASSPTSHPSCRLPDHAQRAQRPAGSGADSLRAPACSPPHPAAGEAGRPPLEVLCDSFRLSYYQQYVGNATAAKQQDGVDLRGYFAWCGGGAAAGRSAGAAPCLRQPQAAGAREWLCPAVPLPPRWHARRPCHTQSYTAAPPPTHSARPLPLVPTPHATPSPLRPTPFPPGRCWTTLSGPMATPSALASTSLTTPLSSASPRPPRSGSAAGLGWRGPADGARPARPGRPCRAGTKSCDAVAVTYKAEGRVDINECANKNKV
jgi:hypothetical protein